MPHLSPAEIARFRPMLENPNIPDPPWTVAELMEWIKERETMNEDTMEQRMRDLRRLEREGVRIHGTKMELVESFVAYRRRRIDVEHMAPTALVNDFRAILPVLQYRVIPRECLPPCPKVQRPLRAEMPTPEMMHDLLHARFAPDPAHSYEQHLVQYTLALGIAFGRRFPSEFVRMKLDAYDPLRHVIRLRHTKTDIQPHRFPIKPRWLCCGRTRLSLANYVNVWRKKVDHFGSDAFLLDPDGKPFKSPEALTRWMDGRVQPVAHALGFGQKGFERYHGYLLRHVCANARLIDFDEDKNKYEAIANLLGHTSTDTLRHEYERDSEYYKEIYGGNWMERIFQGQRTRKPTKNGVLCAPTPVGESAPAGI